MIFRMFIAILPNKILLSKSWVVCPILPSRSQNTSTCWKISWIWSRRSTIISKISIKNVPRHRNSKNSDLSELIMYGDFIIKDLFITSFREFKYIIEKAYYLSLYWTVIRSIELWFMLLKNLIILSSNDDRKMLWYSYYYPMAEASEVTST